MDRRPSLDLAGAPLGIIPVPTHTADRIRDVLEAILDHLVGPHVELGTQVLGVGQEDLPVSEGATVPSLVPL